MAAPEIKQFAEALVALSNSAIAVVKATDQRIVASKEVIDELNAVISQKNQVINRQRQVISSLAEQYAQAEKELKATQQELRSYRGGQIGLSDRAGSISADTSREKPNEFNLPSLKDVLEKLSMDYEGILSSRKSSQSDSSLPYSGSQPKQPSLSHSAPIFPTSSQSHTPNLPDHSSSKRRRPTGSDSAGDDEMHSSSSIPRPRSSGSV